MIQALASVCEMICTLPGMADPVLTMQSFHCLEALFGYQEEPLSSLSKDLCESLVVVALIHLTIAHPKRHCLGASQML